MDKWFYETRNNYVDLIDFVEIISICDLLYNPSNRNCFLNTSFEMTDTDCKNILECKINKVNDNDIADVGRKFVFSCSDGRSMSVEYAALSENYYLNIGFKLNDKDNLLFQFRVRKDNKKDYDFSVDTFRKENIEFIKYNKLKFKKSLLPYCRVVNRYGKVKESENMMKIHHMIVDGLIEKSFTRGELQLFLNNLNKKIQNEKESKVIRNSDNLLNREFIYRALVGDGISR